MPKCLSCKDTGLCPFCMGTGKSDDPNNPQCNYCKGSGHCVFCSAATPAPKPTQTPVVVQAVVQPVAAVQPVVLKNEIPPPPQSTDADIKVFNQGMKQIYSQNQYFQSNLIPGTTPQEHADWYMATMLSPSKMMRYNAKSCLKWIAKYGANTINYLLPFFNYKLKYGMDKEKAGVVEMIEALDQYALPFASTLGELLKHKSVSVRTQAAQTLAKMKKLAAPAEEVLLDVAKNDTSPNVRKYALDALKNFKKLTKEEREEIQQNEEQEKKLLEESKKNEKQIANMKVNLPPPATEFSQYKNVFFMSHALPDYPWVKKIIDEISTWPNCYCWTCERDISPGEDWLTEIYKGLDVCNWYILFWSDNAEKSKWTNEEMREAKTRNVGSGKPKLSVINLGKNQFPTLLNRAQGAMVKSDDDLRQYIENLKSQIQF